MSAFAFLFSEIVQYNQNRYVTYQLINYVGWDKSPRRIQLLHWLHACEYYYRIILYLDFYENGDDSDDGDGDAVVM